jgi:hypothetical protein
LRARSYGGRRFSYEAAAPPNECNGAHPLKFVVRVPDRIEVDLQDDRHFAHRRHLIAGSQHAGAKVPQDLVSKLDIDRDARAFEAKGFQ